MKLNTVLSFAGNCEEAFNFFQEHLGAKLLEVIRYEDSPLKQKTPPEFGRKIFFARLAIADTILMGGDDLPDEYDAPKGFFIALSFQSRLETARVFGILAQNGEVRLPLHETFWAASFGMLNDQFGIPWMLNCEKQLV
jgi:PhnB protein